MKSIRQQIIDLGYVISGDIDHGECFYEKDMLEGFHNNLEKMKNLSVEYFNQNRAEMEEDE